MHSLNRLQPIALTIFRIVLGIIMIGHGWHKVVSISGHMQSVINIGLPGWMAYVSTTAEFAGGIALIAGLLTRLAATGTLITMLVAASTYISKGFTAGPGQHAVDFPLALATMSFMMIIYGAGPYSLDEYIFGKKGSAVSKRVPAASAATHTS